MFLDPMHGAARIFRRRAPHRALVARDRCRSDDRLESALPPESAIRDIPNLASPGDEEPTAPGKREVSRAMCFEDFDDDENDRTSRAR
jgi:hypothetical protein